MRPQQYQKEHKKFCFLFQTRLISSLWLELLRMSDSICLRMIGMGVCFQLVINSRKDNDYSFEDVEKITKKM